MFKFFKFPFASQGDKNSVPDSVQTDGSVSYEQGFGYDYARNLADDPLAKPMPRDKTNQIFHDVTQAIREYQTLGIPDYIELEQNGGEAFAYEKYAVVRYGGSVYVSLKDGNASLPTVAADWDEVPGIKATDAEAEAGTDDTKIMTPAKVNKAIQSLAPKPPAGIIRIASGQPLPASDIGPVWHDDYAAVMSYRTIGSYTGYASSNLGAVEYFESTSAPAGWLKANGATLPASYAALIALRGNATLSDLRGEFIRGLDDVRGVDAGRTIGSWQDSDNKAHGHSYTDPGHAHAQRTEGENSGDRDTDHGGSDTWQGSALRGFYTASATTGITINSSGGTESRPRNVALLACIKY